MDGERRESHAREQVNAREELVEVGDLTFRVRSTRSARPGAEPIVLIHGIGVSHRYLDRLQAELTTTNDVFSIDLPGFGGLPKPGRSLSVPAMAEALAVALGTNRDRPGDADRPLDGRAVGRGARRPAPGARRPRRRHRPGLRQPAPHGRGPIGRPRRRHPGRADLRQRPRLHRLPAVRSAVVSGPGPADARVPDRAPRGCSDDAAADHQGRQRHDRGDGVVSDAAGPRPRPRHW